MIVPFATSDKNVTAEDSFGNFVRYRMYKVETRPPFGPLFGTLRILESASKSGGGFISPKRIEKCRAAELYAAAGKGSMILAVLLTRDAFKSTRKQLRNPSR